MKNIYLELKHQGQVLHLELNKQQHIIGRDRTLADLVVPQDWQIVGRCQAVLREEGEDYHIYDGDGHKPSTNGLYVERTRITSEVGYSLKNGTEIKIGQNPENLVVLRYCNPSKPVVNITPGWQSISLKNRSVLIGRDINATLPLDAPTVSRHHATIDTDAQGRYILQDYSTNGVFVNGQRVNSTAVLLEGATIRIGAYTLVLRGDELQVLDQGHQIRLDACNLVLETKGKRRLDDISFAIEPGQFVALVGGSGAGKSTLMRTLLGTEQTTQGVVYLNGEDLRKNFNIYRMQIGYVPQDDIIHQELTVAEVLTYAAKLRLPPDIDLAKVVEKTLQDVEMSHRQNARVCELSGGQRKRVSIGVELLADPKLFFLDEPTSGLDPGLDKKMMQLLRKLADQGRTVILVTHATANIKLCDRVVFLGQGGRLCYFGPPNECLQFFGVKDDFADIYNQLEKPENVIDQAEIFHQSDDYRRYVTNHLSPGNQTSQVNAGNDLPYFIPKTAFIKSISGKSAYSPDVLLLNRPNLINEPLWKKESTVNQPASIPLVVEVVSTNWRDDYHKKLADYEEIGIPEYWIVDYAALGGRAFLGSPKQPTISVYELIEGEYQVTQFRGNEHIQSPTFPELALTAEQIFQAGVV